MSILYVIWLGTVGVVLLDCIFSQRDSHGRNVALHKPTHQMPGTFCDSNFCHISDLAVDGDTDDFVNYNKCSHTKRTLPYIGASWEVDLKGAFYLSSISIHNRDEGIVTNNGVTENKHLRKRLEGFVILGSTNENSQKILIYKNSDLSYHNKTINILLPADLKRVKFTAVNISLAHNAKAEVFLTLCEVQVFMALNCTIQHVGNGSIGYENNSKIIPVNIFNVVPEGTKLVFSCNEGFLPSTPTDLWCHESGLSSLPHCAAIECPYIDNNNANMSIIYIHGTSTYGSVWRAKCNKGYELSSGNLTRICTENGSWSGKEPICTTIECPYIDNSNEKLSITYIHGTSTYGSVWRAKCNKGYELSSGNLTRICTDIGSWSGKEPICTIITCESPMNDIRLNLLSQSNNSYGSIWKSRCQRGYKLQSGNLSRTCLADKSWSGTKPICEEVKCHPPQNITNGNYFQTDFTGNETKTQRNKHATYKYNASLIVECNEGFSLQGITNYIRICSDNGSWTQTEPNCIAKETPSANAQKSAVIGGSVAAAVIVIIAAVAVGFIILNKKRLKSKDYFSHVLTGQPGTNDGNSYGNIAVSYQDSSHLTSAEESTYSSIEEKGLSSPGKHQSNCLISQPSDVGNDSHNEKHKEYSFDEKSEEYYNVTQFEKKSPTAIMLEDLVDFVLTAETKLEKLREQFDNFPVGLIRGHQIASEQKNLKKNRYKQIYAYITEGQAICLDDDNRVVLKTGDRSRSDYINASYIHGFNRVRAYIASQGFFIETLKSARGIFDATVTTRTICPTKDIVNEFWEMIWQEDTPKIVMLTNLREENKMKCIQYWPIKGSELFGKVTVTLKETEHYSDFIIRTLAIIQASHKTKIVRHFQYTAWPDRGVPKFSSSIVNFMSKVRRTKSHGTGPTLIHCSAGIGRTGTYIALDILTEQGKSLGYVDIAACIAALRQQRVNMVQNLDQYVFLHSALTETLMLSSKAISSTKFQQAYQELLQVNPGKRKRNIEIKFEMLRYMSPVADEKQYISANEVRNKKRNRCSDILPVSEFMPSLSRSSKDGYINAVYLPSYKDSKAMIITQMPLANTKEDFWALVQEQNVHTIVMVNAISEVQKDEIYWPDVGECQSFNGAEVECIGKEIIGQHTVVTLQVMFDAKEHTITQIQCGYWPAKQDSPNKPRDIIETIELVQKLQQQSGNHPVIVHCMNGLERSGLFCVISAVVERLNIEHDVAITQIIEQMRCCRPQIITSVDQFQFCYEVVQEYIQQFNEYSNFSAI